MKFDFFNPLWFTMFSLSEGPMNLNRETHVAHTDDDLLLKIFY